MINCQKIRTQVLVGMFAALAPLALFAAYQIREDCLKARADVEDAARVLAQVNAAEVARIMRVTENFLEKLATNPDIRALDGRRCGHWFAHFPQLFPQHTNLLTKDLEGYPVCSALPIPQGARINLRNYLEDVLHTNGFAMGVPNKGALSGRWVIPLDYPIRDDNGKILGTIGTPLDLLNFNPFVGENTFEGLPPGTAVSLLAKDMTVLARSVEPERWVGTRVDAESALAELIRSKSGTARALSPFDPTEAIHAAAPVAGTNWAVVVGIPAAPLDGAIDTLIRRWLLAGALVTGFSIAIAAWLAARISRPISALAEHVDRLRAGTADTRALPTGNEETARLAATFNAMIEEMDQAREALAASELRYRTLFSHAKLAMLLIDPETGRIVDANKAAETYYGWDGPALRTMAISQINTLPPREVAEEMIRARQENRNHFLFRHRRADGSIRDVEVHSGPLPVGDRTLLYSMVHDITDRVQAQTEAAEKTRQMEQQALRLRLLLATATDGIHVLDDQGNLVMASDSFYRHMGYDPSRAPALSVEDWDAHFTPEEIRSKIDYLLEHPDSFNTRHRRRDGSVFDVEIATNFYDLDGRRFLFCSARDISERLADAEKLARSNAELEHFAYVASHDLRQPLRMISSYLGLIERRLGDAMTGEIAEFFGYATDGAKRLDALIVGLLDYSRIGRSAKTFTAQPLDRILSEALLNLEVAIRDAGADVHLAPDLPTIQGDHMELVRLFQNLIGNAVKYHAPGRAPVIHIAWRRDGSQAVIRVEDNGIGIADSDRERVFSLFQRAVALSEYEGTGIGLSLCRKIVQHHGGRIWIESEPGQGSTFLVSFPLAPSDA